MENRNASTTEFYKLLLPRTLTDLSEKCRPIFVGSTMRHLLGDAVVRRWKPSCEGTFVGEQVLRDSLEGVGHLGLRAKIHDH